MLSVLFAVCNNVFLHILSDKKITYNPFAFNGFITLLWLVILFAYNRGRFAGTTVTFIYGAVYGCMLTGFIFFKSMAMSSGPVSLASLIGCSSFIVTTVFNAIFWKEKITFFNVAGIILMIVSVFLVTYRKRSDADGALTLKWKIYCALFFLFSAGTGIVFRLHQSADAGNTNEMMIVSAAFATALLFAVYGARLLGKKKPAAAAECALSRKKQLAVYAAVTVACGAFSCLYNRINIYLSGAMQSTVFFPVFNGGVVILSFFAGWAFFKEKPNALKIIGSVAGFIAIILSSRIFGLV